MDSEHLKVVPIHKYPQYLRQCCELINSEWPRSETARMMSLQASRDELPTNLILINNKEKHILGHCKLTSIPSIPNSCFVETVVISKSMRGKKLGTFLMKQAEQYCKDVLKLEMIHLSTRGQEVFYAKLGYEVCAPVSIYGSNISYDVGSFSSKTSSLPIRNIDNCAAAPIDIEKSAAPPPPPMPKPQNVVINTLKSNRTYMFKHII